MVWLALLQFTDTPVLGMVVTTLDQFAVWGALGLVVALIAWREYTLPKIVSTQLASKPAGEK